jgi:hypothetical protein
MSSEADFFRDGGGVFLSRRSRRESTQRPPVSVSIPKGGTTGANLGCQPSEAQVRERRARLAGVFYALNDAATEHAADVQECGERFLAARCPNGHYPAFPLNCGQPLCPSCQAKRLAADWLRRDVETKLPWRLRLYRLRTRELLTGPGCMRKVASRYAEWRKRQRRAFSAGVHGQRFERRDNVLSPVILVALDPESPDPESTAAFDVEVIGEVDREDVLAWFQSEYTAEAFAWETRAEAEMLIFEVRGRRRFQGFGRAHGASAEPAAPDRQDSLGRVAGGSGRGAAGSKSRACPFCGQQVELLGYIVGPNDVERTPKGPRLRDPPREEAAA